MSPERTLPSGTVTMLFTDIEGSTRLLRELGDRYGELLADHRRLLREAFAAHGGSEIDTQGDAFFVAFGRARHAVEAAVQAQRALAGHAWPGGVECRVRMGLHTGEPSVGEEGYHGIGLHRGARIAAVARGGQVLLSSATAELVQDDLPSEMHLRDLGHSQLKDIERREHLYQLVAEGLPAELPARNSPSERRRGRGRAVLAAGVAAVVALTAIVLLVNRGGSTSDAAMLSADSVALLSPSSHHVFAEIGVRAAPGAVASCFGSLWVAEVDVDSVQQIDPTTRSVTQTYTVGQGPDAIACGGRFVWVANGLAGSVSKLDPQSGTVAQTIPVGDGPAGLASDSRYVWVANSGSGTVSRINLADGRVLPPIPVVGTADAIAIGYGAAWVSSEAGGTVTRIDQQSGATQPIDASSSASAIATGAGGVWVANDLAGTVTRILPYKGQVGAAIPVKGGAASLAVVNGSVWVSNDLGGTLTEIDPADNTVERTVTTGNRPQGVAAAGTSLAVAVTATGRPGGTLKVFGAADDLSGLDPALAYSTGEFQIVAMTNDGLSGFRRVGGPAGSRLVPDLAKALPKPGDGGRAYTFYLRRGIRFSNGAKLEPQDFLWGLERSFELQRDGLYTQYYGAIRGAARCLAAPKRPCDLADGIRADDATDSVTFYLTRPDPDFLDVLALPAADALPPGTPLHPVHGLPATGPYRVASFSSAHGARLVRNPAFHQWSQAAQPRGYPDVIDVGVGGSASAEIKAVVHGSIDLITRLNAAGIPRGVIATLETQYPSLVEVNPLRSTWYLALNTHTAPFDQLKARRALNYAMNRTQLLDLTLGRGLGQVTCQILPPDFAGYRRNCPYTLDLAKARQLVRSSGTLGETVGVWVPNYIHFANSAYRYIVSVLDDIGYHASWHYTKAYVGKQIVFNGWLSDYPEPGGFLGQTLTCGASPQSNPGAFCAPAIDREIRRAQELQALQPDASYQQWAKVDRQLTSAAPWVAFANGRNFDVVSPRVDGYQYNPQWGALLDQLWIR